MDSLLSWMQGCSPAQGNFEFPGGQDSFVCTFECPRAALVPLRAAKGEVQGEHPLLSPADTAP